MQSSKRDDVQIKTEHIITPLLDIVLLLLDSSFFGLPVTRTLKAILKSSNSYRDYLMIVKLKECLSELDKVSPAERKEWIYKLDRDGEREEICSKLFVILERADDIEKSKLIAYALKSYLRNNIDKDTLMRFWHVIDKVFMHDLTILDKMNVDYSLNKGLSHVSCESLCNVGLASHVIENNHAWSGGSKPIFYTVSEVGELFIKNVLSEWEAKNDGWCKGK